MRNNLKAIGILFSLSIFCYGIYNVTSLYRTIHFIGTAEVETEIGENIGDIVTDVVWESIEPIEGICPECKQEGKVLGQTSSCSDVFNELITTPVLIEGAGNIDFKDGRSSGNMVSKNAEILVLEVTVPAILLSGSSQVKDSNQIPSMDNAALKAAGNLFASDYGRHIESPFSAKEYDSNVNGTVYKEPFGSETEMTFAQVEEKGSIAEINIETDEESICLDCQDSNYNPDKSNVIAEEMNKTLSIPGGQNASPQNEEEYLTVDSGMVVDFPSAQIACRRSTQSVVLQLFANISATLFNHCNTPDGDGNYPNDCVRAEDIVIRTNSFLGDYNTCKENGICTNTFMNRRSMIMLSPPASSSFDQNFLITTPCKVSVDGVAYNVKCLWDVSYIALEYYYQWQNNNPGKEFPEWSVYWGAIEEDMLNRS